MKEDKIKTEDKVNIRVEMQGEMLDRFKKVKATLGIESGTDVFRYLISEYYHNRIGLKSSSIDDAQTRTLTEISEVFGTKSGSDGYSTIAGVG